MLGSKAIDPTIRQAWLYLFESWNQKEESNPYVRKDQIKRIIAKEGWSSQCLREYAALNRPFLKVHHNRSLVPPKRDKKLSLNEILSISIKYPQQKDDAQIADQWLALCIQELRKNLEHALQIQQEVSRHRSISIGPLYSEYDPRINTGNLEDYIIHFTKLFERLLKLDVVAARKEFSLWPANDQDVFDRLRIWAGGMPDLLTEQSFVSLFLELSDEIFWDRDARSDLLLVLARRWQQLSIDSRVAIEARLLGGPARWDTESEQHFLERNAWITLNYLYGLVENRCAYTFDLATETERLRQHAPNWEPKIINTAVDLMGKNEEGNSHNRDYAALLSEGLSTILSKSQKLSDESRNFIGENSLFGELCKNKPVRAFSALTHSANNGEFPKWAWYIFLYSPARDNDKLKFSAFISAKIAIYAPEDLIEIINLLCRWLNKIANPLATEFYPIYSKTVDKLIAAIECRPSVVESSSFQGNRPIDWIHEAQNSPVGDMAKILMIDPELNRMKENTRLPSHWVSLIERLLALPSDSRRYALVILAKNLEWFYSVDPHWTEKNLLSVFSSENVEDQQAVWSGFLWTRSTPRQSLYMRLKLDMLNFAKNGDLFRQELDKPLLGIILAGWGSIDEKSSDPLVPDEELYGLILHCNDESRCHLIWQLERWSNQDKGWESRLPQFFTDVWPRQKSAKTPRVSLALFELLFSSIERFEQLAKLMLPLLSSIKIDFLELSTIENILDDHPELSLAIFYKVFSEIPSRDLPYALDQALDRIADADKQLRADPRWLKLKRKSNDR